MAEYSIYNSQWTAQQIEASIGKNPRIGESGNWEVWNMSTMQYVDTGVLAEGKSVSRVERTSGTGLPGTTDTYTIYDDDETVIGTFDVHNGSDGQGSPGSQTPKMNGTAAVGTANAYSREDHVHPSDTSKADLVDGKVPSGQLPPMDYQPTINVSGILKGNGAGGVSAAVAGTDFAPGGYGLGGGAKVLTSADDLNDIWQSGLYQYLPNDAPANAPPYDLVADVIFLFVQGNAANAFYQEIVGVTNGVSANIALNSKMVRARYGATYQGWSWVNPPMLVGVAYRTTERYLGKPVYALAFSSGALPNATTKIVYAPSAQNVDQIIYCGGFGAGYALPNFYPASSYSSFTQYDIKVSVSVSTTTGIAVAIGTGMDRTNQTAMIVVKYTKTTD